DQVLSRAGLALRPEVTRKRPGRAGRSDEFYAVWAAAYVNALANGSRNPIVDLAAAPPIESGGRRGPESSATVRAIVSRARQRGILGPAPSGRAGGDLTPKARRILGQRDWTRPNRTTPG